MQVMHVLSAFLLFSLFETGISQNNGCCTAKKVGEVEYRLINADGPTNGFNCIDNCVYEQFGMSGSRFCFAEGDLTVVCIQQRIEQFTSDVAMGIVERVKEHYTKLAAKTSFVTVEAKLESFHKEMTESTGLYPNSSDPLQSALEMARPIFFGVPEDNIEAIVSGLEQISSEVKNLMSSKSVTVQDVKEKVEIISKNVHQEYSKGVMFNCEWGLSLVTLTVFESMAMLFLPVSNGGQAAEKTLFDAMYANTKTILQPYKESECCDNVVRAWQGSSGAILTGLIKATKDIFPDVSNFNNVPVSNFIPVTSALTKVAIEAGARGSRMISSEIFKDLMTPSNK